jgi:thymidylate synthase (FAD)
MNQKVELVSVTPDAEKTMGYVARVSNPSNQDNPKVAGLLKYCIKHGHWSVFEQAFMTLEIHTTRGLAAQLLRHRSMTYQEFSQRYADSSLLTDAGMKLYKEMLDADIAKECSRFVLPLAVPTKLYMTGSVRSWIHYIDLRSGHGTQKEHMEIANMCKAIFVEQFPICAEAMEWT